MGCAGSRPHLLPSLSSHHSNSPQKGFILFDAKTIEYLRANETHIKQQLKQRCEQKLTYKHSTNGSKLSLLSNAKKTLLLSSQNSSLNSGTISEASNIGLKSNKSNVSLSDDITFKTNVINSAVDYVLKYALNDFDIENFKSSNHLSLKQIRKEIMKKNSKLSASKLNSSLSMNVSSNLTDSSATMSTSSTINDFNIIGKSYDPVFYKQTLNAAIDEFGSFIQENFIVINEFQIINEEETVNEEPIKQEVKIEQTETEPTDDEALKLKEALAIARQNFYKGKVSTVCLTKTGGYVVKEVPPDTESIAVTELKPIDLKQEHRENEELKQLDDNLEQIKLLINKAFDCTLQEKLTINEFFLIKTHLVNLLNETIESIVNYTTKSSTVPEIETLNASQHADLLISNLEKSKRIIENLNFIDENDFNSIDEKLVEAILNLDYVNKEFKSYLKILEDSQLKELETKRLNKSNDLETSELLLNKNIKIRMLADQIDELNSKLPKKLFSCKCLPHPTEANNQTAVETIAENVQETEEVEVKEDIRPEPEEIIEVKEQEVVEAEPTVDAELIIESKPLEITDINLHDMGSDNLLHINIASSNESDKKQETSSDSTVSSLSSPSVSTSSMSPPSESISPVQDLNKDEELIDSIKSTKCSNLVEESSLDLVEKFKCAPEDNLHSNEISYLVSEVSTNIVSQMTYLDKFERQYEENDSFSDLVNSNKEKSSSSSSDIMTNSSTNVDSTCTQQNEVKFRNDLMESNSNKRMSLDEELFYHLEDVDKKVKYMNETCSENEDDDDNEEEFDFDENAELENGDDERLFHPRTPAKIKNDIKNNRSADLQNEIKQISNVIQDLVQTINVRNSTNLVQTKIDIIEEVNDNDGHLILSSYDDNNSDTNLNNNPDSEDGGSQNSADSNESNSIPSSKLFYNKKLDNAKRLSLNSNNSFSNIPIRQKVLTKQKVAIEDEQNLEFNKSINLCTSVNYEAFVDVTTLCKQQEQVQLNSPDILNKSTSSQKFRSKLPVKK